MPSLLGSLSFFKGHKPKVPEIPALNMELEQRKALTQNLAAFEDASKLGGQVNQFNLQQLQSMLEQISPGFRDMLAKGAPQVQSLLSGEIPKDVAEAVKRNTAYQSLAGGFSGSGMSRNLEARDLGLTSLDIIGKGFDAASRWIASVGSVTPQQFNVASMFLTPQQRIDASMQEKSLQFQRNWLRSRVNAAPSPSAAAFGNTLDFLADTFIPIAAGAAGGGGGGMMGGMGGGAKGGGGGGAGGAGVNTSAKIGTNLFGYGSSGWY